MPQGRKIKPASAPTAKPMLLGQGGGGSRGGGVGRSPSTKKHPGSISNRDWKRLTPSGRKQILRIRAALQFPKTVAALEKGTKLIEDSFIQSDIKQAKALRFIQGKGMGKATKGMVKKN